MKQSRMEEFSPLDAFKFGGRIRRATDQSEAEMALAKARGKARAEGFEEGVRQTEARIDHEVQDTLSAIAAAVELARADRLAVERELAGAARRIALAFLARIAPKLAETALLDEIADIAAEVMNGPSGADLRIRVAEARRDEIEQSLQSRGVDIAVDADPSLEPARAQAAWAGGFDDIDLGALAERALAILDAGLAAAEAAQPSSDALESPR